MLGTSTYKEQIQSEFLRIPWMPITCSQIIDIRPFDYQKLQCPRKSGYRWTFDINSEISVYFIHACIDIPSYYR